MVKVGLGKLVDEENGSIIYLEVLVKALPHKDLHSKVTHRPIAEKSPRACLFPFLILFTKVYDFLINTLCYREITVCCFVN